MVVYNDVFTELFGDDKEEAMRYVHDDAQFDAWISRYSAKNKAKTNQRTKGKPISKDEYFKRTKGMLPNPGNNKDG